VVGIVGFHELPRPLEVGHESFAVEVARVFNVRVYSAGLLVGMPVANDNGLVTAGSW